MKGYRFSRKFRLTRPSDYQNVFGGKNVRVSNHHWTLLAVDLPTSGSKPEGLDGKQGNENNNTGARLGLAIAKKRARRALDRNRQKRIIRESFRHNRLRLRNLDIVVMNRDEGTKASSAELRVSLEQLWDKLLAKSNR